MSNVIQMRSECDQVNAEVREIINAMPKDAQASLYGYLQQGLTTSRIEKINTIVFGLALLGFANVITNIAELKEENR